MRRLLPVILLAALALPSLADADVSFGAGVRLLSPSGAGALEHGSLPVRITMRREGRARVVVVGDGGAVLAGPRKARFRGPASRRVAVPLTAAGREAFARCRATPVQLRLAAHQPHVPRLRALARAAHTRRDRRRAVVTGSSERCYRVGFALRSVNPDDDGTYGGEPVHLGGYGFGANPVTGARVATGILGDGVQVRAMTISDGTTPFAIADVEMQGWFVANKDGPYGLIDMRKAVEERTAGRLKAEQVVIQSDHTHGGPDPLGVWGGMPVAYRQFVFDRTVEAIIESFERARPAELRYGAVEGRDLQSNQFDYDATNAAMDSELRVLQAVRPNGKVLATLLNASIHTTVLGGSNTKVTGDWVTRVNAQLEQRLGGRVLTVVGTLGRTQPSDEDCPDEALDDDAKSLCRLDTYAARVVARALDAVAVAQPLPADPVVAAHSFYIQDPGTSAAILGLNYVGDPAGAPLNRAVTPPWLTGNVVGTVTASVRIGDVLLSTFPGEAYPQVPLTIREGVPGLRGYMTAGLANDQLGYLIAPYEAYPEPIRRTFFNQRGDEVSPIDNDTYFFNVSHTMGERVICAGLRGAGEVFGRGLQYREARERCGAFPNDLAHGPGADVELAGG